MSDSNHHSEFEEQPTYQPASTTKRVIAWVGVVYMVLIVLLNVYPFFHGGAYLSGVAPLLVCPGAIGLLIIALIQLRQGGSQGKKAGMVVLAIACVFLCVIGLIDGLPGLAAGWGVQG
jgi:NADH:ubiquinone oxidoreductase subunit 6 (subunit J)